MRERTVSYPNCNALESWSRALGVGLGGDVDWTEEELELFLSDTFPDHPQHPPNPLSITHGVEMGSH